MTLPIHPLDAREIADTVVVDSPPLLSLVVAGVLEADLTGEGGPATVDLDDVRALGQVLAAAADRWAQLNGHAEGWARKKAREEAESVLLGALYEGMGGYFG